MKHRVQVRLWYGIFLSVFTAVLAILLIVVAAQIYYADPEGDPYSRALVGERLLPLLAPMILYGIAVIAGGVLAYVFPAKQEKAKAGKEVSYRRLRARVPQGEGEAYETEYKKLRTYELWRYILWGVSALFALSAAIVTVVYLCDVTHFSGKSPNREILEMLRVCLPLIGGAFVLCMGTALYEGLTLSPRMVCVKQLLVLGKGNPPQPTPQILTAAETALGVIRSEKAIWILRGILLAAGITLLILGIVNGGTGDVLKKAIKICTECVGLG